MLQAFSEVLNYLLGVTKSKSAPVIAIAVTAVHLIIFFVEIIISIVKKPKRAHVYTSCFSIILLVVQGYFSVCDYLSYRQVFLSSQSVYLYLTLSAILSIIFNLIIFAICNAKRIKANAECLKQEEPLTKSKAQTYFTSESETECLTENGWLNVGYLKWLISNLKTKNSIKSKGLNTLWKFYIRHLMRSEKRL